MNMKMTGSNTKEHYLSTSLRLFAEKGYDGVSVMDIADAMGVSTPALYKHFPNKRALFDALMDRSKHEFQEHMEQLTTKMQSKSDNRKKFVRMSQEDQIRFIQSVFIHVLEDEEPRLFRRFMTVEQFHHPEFAIQLNRRYIDWQTDAHEALMQEFIDVGIYREGNAKVMAMQFTSPIILYIEVCDREPERKEEALQMIEAHMRQFDALYRM